MLVLECGARHLSQSTPAQLSCIYPWCHVRDKLYQAVPLLSGESLGMRLGYSQFVALYLGLVGGEKCFSLPTRPGYEATYFYLPLTISQIMASTAYSTQAYGILHPGLWHTPPRPISHRAATTQLHICNAYFTTWLTLLILTIPTNHQTIYSLTGEVHNQD